MPKFTKKQIVDRFRAGNPDNTLSDDRLFFKIMEANPKLKSAVSDYEREMGKSYLDYIPDFLKEGYNRSLTGTADELLSGRKRFDMSKWNPGVIEDLAASATSLLVPTDWAALGPIGKVTGTVGKVLLKSFVGAGVPSKMVTPMVRKAIANKIGASAGIFGAYEGLGNALRQQIDTGEIKIDEVGERALHGALVGGVSGVVGGTLGARGASSLTKVAGEVGAIGTAGPIFEGEMPTPQDYFHTAGIVLGVKGGHKLFSSPGAMAQLFQGKPRTVQYKPEASEARSLARAIEAPNMETALHMEQWTSGAIQRQGKEYGRVRIQRTRGDNIYQLEDLDTGKSKSIGKNLFHKIYSRSEKPLDVKDIRMAKEREIADYESKLGYKSDGPEAQSSRKRFWTNKEQSKYSTLPGATDAQLFKYKEHLKLEDNIKSTAERLQKDGLEISNMPNENFFDKYLPKALSNVLTGAKGPGMRITDPMGRRYVLEVGNYMDTRAQYVSKLLNDGLRLGIDKSPSKKELRKLGFNKHKKYKDNERDYWEDVTRRKGLGELGEWNSVTNKIFKAAEDAGVIMPGKIENYVPRMLKPEFAEVIFNDVMTVSAKMREASNLFDTFSNTKDWIRNNPEQAKRLEDIIRNSSLNDATRKAISRNMDNGEYSALRAFASIGRTTYNDLFNPFGNLEKSRVAELPAEYYEKDWRVLYHKYAYGAAKRIAEVKHFGRKGEKFSAMRKAVEARDHKNEADIMQNMQEHIVGSIHRDPTKNFSPKVKNAFQDVMAWQTASKIALGTATIPNVTQPMISSALDAGYWRFIRGVVSLADPKVRRMIKESGATEYNMLTELLGTSTRTRASSKVADSLSKWSGFSGINKINQYTAAASGKIFIKDLHKLANKSPIKTRRLWAQDKLGKLGVDYKSKLSEDTMLHGMNRFAKDMNLQKDILKDPLIMNNPRSQWYFQFDRFAVRQYKLLDGILREDLRRGNVASLLRLGIAGYAGGTGVVTAKKYFKEWLGGEPVFEPGSLDLPDDFEELIQNLAAVGAAGMMGDVISSAFEVSDSPVSAVKFLALTPLWGDVEKTFGFFQAMERDALTYGPDFVKRVPSRVGQLLGTVPKQILRRVEPEGMTEEKLSQEKSRAVKQINRYLDDENYEKAMERVRLWNRINIGNPISGKSISFKNVITRKMKKLKKQMKNVYKFDDINYKKYLAWTG